MTSIILIINIFLYLGINFAANADGTNDLNKQFNFRYDNDLLEMMFHTNLDNSTQSLKENWTQYPTLANANFTTLQPIEAGYSEADNFVVVDPIKYLFGAIGMVYNIIVSPLTLFFDFHMPFYIGLILGVPYFFILFMALMAFIRGAGD
jgi:hypothetical protein